MRILILGGDGMLGHHLLSEFEATHDVAVTLRRPFRDYHCFGLFAPERSFCGVDARSFDTIARAVDAFEPEVVINAIGLVKQRDDANDRLLAIEINSMLPHRLAALCRTRGARLIHISTDCVFSGRRGLYREADVADAEDIYGRTKLLGEVCDPGCLTLRTSFIGYELSRKRSLLEWLLAQRGQIRGFTRAVFSGLTAHELSHVLRLIVERHPSASGLYHLASRPIDKFRLLTLIKRSFGLPIEIIPDEGVAVDRSLDGSLFNERFSYQSPSWEKMIADLCHIQADHSAVSPSLRYLRQP
ncbi:NAD(P)-dependent oxidoreductase [Agaricicola taiwanensis]|uniref:dTDP-4-dehydrorhamnose reductase n=1 Tax=Agaricicola taiwanensis TaxID=591372 RepID=A0A8J2VT17_9RHOB|nr:SDR family oxidoreductase [Agaricicola taiwanensis]GGE39835.1 NAD(P)-dependent oxidoreductase [Agaricicola taiwanensis]